MSSPDECLHSTDWVRWASEYSTSSVPKGKHRSSSAGLGHLVLNASTALTGWTWLLHIAHLLSHRENIPARQQD